MVAADPGLPTALWSAAREHGLLTRWLRDGVAVAPPLVISDHEVSQVVDAFTAALATLSD